VLKRQKCTHKNLERRKMRKRFVMMFVAVLFALTITLKSASGLYETTHPCFMYRYDLARTGATTSTAPNSNQTLWSHTSTSTVGTPIIVEGKVIFNVGTRVYAVDETTGVKLWESISFPNSLTGVPAYAYGRIYVGSSGGYIYCLNATTGVKLWEYQATEYPGRIENSPAVVDGRDFFGTTDNYLYAINAYTGLALSPQWRYTAGGGIYSAPTIEGDFVYFGCDDGKLYALNRSGTLPSLKWVYDTDYRVRCTPTVYGGMVIFGTYQNRHTLVALNKTTGTLLWSYILSSSWNIENPVAVDNGIIYFAPNSGNKAYALYADAPPGVNYTETDATIRKWSHTLDNWNPTEPTVADNKMFLTAYTKLYALNISDGHRLWTYTFTYYAENPIVADGHIFIPSSTTLWCFGGLYPPLTYYYTVTPVAGYTYTVKLVINATPSSQLDTSGLINLHTISYTLQGIPGTTGMSNITIPNEMLGGPYTITVDGGAPQYQATPNNNGTHTSLYFTYLHMSTHTVEIIGTTSIPEFPTAAILPLLITFSVIAIALRRKLN